ncbi:MAG TPA: GNAT family N-acetyltransferase [Solirubrobacteraceae bacterium]|nr:GNAT family N-acetyltransferase [Solirubrobacteraceae bacterium]
MVEIAPLERADAEALRAIRERPEVVAWWGRQADDFPFDEPESTRFAIRVDGEVAGMIQYGEELDPEYRHAGIDLFVDPEHHGRGVGTEAIGLVLRVLMEERGHHRVTIDPAVDNAAAIRSYEKAGFTPVGVTRRSWRDPDGVWRDSLLMERVEGPR